MYHRRRKAVGAVLVAASLGFHFVTALLYARQPDRFAAFTLFPIWIWGSLGLALCSVAFVVCRAPLALFTTAVWAVTILIVADETRALGRIGIAPLKPGAPARYSGRSVLRIATINWGGSDPNFPEGIVRFQPDIVCIQEIPHPYRLRQLNRRLYGGRGDYRYDKRSRCGVVVRGEILRSITNPTVFRSQNVRIRLPNGRMVELVNLHLQAASTDLRLWNRDCWRTHRINRQLRRTELGIALQILQSTNRNPRLSEVIIAGDFNAPAGDRIYRSLRHDYFDTFRESGTGWSNTYHRRFPILRLDHIFVSKSFLPVRSRAVTIEESDHRMVVSDVIMK